MYKTCVYVTKQKCARTKTTKTLQVTKLNKTTIKSTKATKSAAAKCFMLAPEKMSLFAAYSFVGFFSLLLRLHAAQLLCKMILQDCGCGF